MSHLNWEQLVQQFQALVWTTIRRLVDNDADAADCFQETFITAVETARRQPVRHMSGLLTRIATARAIDQVRYRIRHRQFKERFRDGRSIEIDSPDPGAGLEQGELAQALRLALGTLPSQQVQAFCLKHLSGWTQREIAVELQTSPSAVGVMIHRAKKQLQQHLHANGHAQMRIDP